MRKSLFLLFTAVAWAQPPLSLDEARSLAREHNAEVKTARMELESASETRKATFTKWFPQVSATAGAMVAKDPLVSTQTPQMNLPVYDGNPASLATATQAAYVPSMNLEAGKWANLLQLTVQQPLYVGGRVKNGNRLAKLGEEVAQSKVALAQREAVALAQEKYWMLLTLQEKRRTLDAYDSLLASLQRRVGDAVKGGLTSRNDALKVSLQRSRLRVQRQQLESGLRLATRDLRQHLGLPEDSTLTLSDTLTAPEDPSPLRSRREGAEGRRLEVRLLAQGVQAETLQEQLEAGTMLPTVAVGATAMRAELKGLDPITNAMAFAVVNVPLSDAWSGLHSTRSHTLKVREASLREAETRRKIALGIDKDWDDLDRTWQSSLVADEAVAQAEVNSAEETDRHRNGMSTLSDLLEAQALRQQSLDSRLDARKDYWLAREAWLRSCAMEDR